MLRQFGVRSLRLPTFKWIFNNFSRRFFILRTHAHTHALIYMGIYIVCIFFFSVGRAQQAISSWAQALSACLTDRNAKQREADNGPGGEREARGYSFKSMPKKYHLCKSNKWQTALDSTRAREREREGDREMECQIEVEAKLRHQRGPDTAARTCQMGLGHKFHYKASKAS